MDASDGHRYLNKRSIDSDKADTDEHWLWSNVNRMKRSLDSVLYDENRKSGFVERVKRDLFDFWGLNSDSDSETTTTSTTAAPSESEKKDESPSWPWNTLDSPSSSDTKETTTTKKPNDNILEDIEQSDHTEHDDEFESEDDEDNEIDGSGLHKIDDRNDVLEPKLERFCK